MLNRIMVFGDSLLRGVVLDSHRRYTRLPVCTAQEVQNTLNIEIENYSVFGMTATKALRRYFSDGKQSFRDAAVLIEYGGNDCNFNWKEISDAPLGEHWPVTELPAFENALEKMVRTVQKEGGTPILMTLPPLDSERFLAWVSADGARRENILLWLGDVEHIYRWQERYSNAVMRVAARTRASLADVRDCFLARADYRDCVCEDGMHLNQKGNMLMADFFIRYANRHRLELAV